MEYIVSHDDELLEPEMANLLAEIHRKRCLIFYWVVLHLLP